MFAGAECTAGLIHFSLKKKSENNDAGAKNDFQYAIIPTYWS